MYKSNPTLDFIFESLDKNISSIKASEDVKFQFNQFKEYYINSAIDPDYFFTQIRINEKFDGLVSDSIFFDKNRVYDIVIGKHNLNLIEIPWSNLTNIALRTIPIIATKTEKNLKIKEVTGQKIRLELLGGTSISLYYEVSGKEFSEIFELFTAIKSNI